MAFWKTGTPFYSSSIQWLIRTRQWLSGDDPTDTRVRVRDDLQSMASLEATVDSGRTGAPVRVRTLPHGTRESTSVD